MCARGCRLHIDTGKIRIPILGCCSVYVGFGADTRALLLFGNFDGGNGEVALTDTACI